MASTTLKNDGLAPLGMQQLQKFCPAIFSDKAHPKVSTRYGFISTKQVLDTVMKEGLVPVECRYYFRRDPKMLQFTKHMLKFRPAGNIGKIQVGDVVPEVIVVGSHDRSSPFQFYGGLHRLVCSNGMVVSVSDTVQPIKLRHTSNVVDSVHEACKTVVKHHTKVFEHMKVMERTKMDERKQLEFAKAALNLRFPHAGVIDPAAVLEARRESDKGDSVWKVFNRVQENLIKGNLPGRTADGRITRTHGVTAIVADLRINTGLWELAMEAIA